MKENGCENLYICVWVGLTQTRPTLSYSWPFDQNPDGSGSIQRSWSVSLIRIHQIRGFGLWDYGPWAFLRFFLFLLIITPSFLLIEPICMPNFLQKIPKNCHEFLDTCLAVWWWYCMLKLIKKMYVPICPLDVNIFVYFCEVSCIVFVLIQYHVILMRVIRSRDTFAMRLWSSPLFCELWFWFSCLENNMNLLSYKMCIKCVCVKFERMAWNFLSILEMIFSKECCFDRKYRSWT